MRPSKRQWIEAFLSGLERSQHTGTVDLCLRYDRGNIEQVIPRVCGGSKDKACDQGGRR